MRAEDGFGRFPAAAHFAEADEAVIGFDFDDGADEAAPVAAVGVAQRGFERDGDGGGADVGDFHDVWAADERDTEIPGGYSLGSVGKNVFSAPPRSACEEASCKPLSASTVSRRNRRFGTVLCKLLEGCGRYFGERLEPLTAFALD